MTEEQAKQHLAEMLDSFTPGSILHLLGDVYRQQARDAMHTGDHASAERLTIVEHALYVVGIGIDSANPS